MKCWKVKNRLFTLCGWAVLAALVILSPGQSVLAQEVPGDGPDVIVHIVRSGESLSDIAARYGVSAEAILEANGLSGAPEVSVGRPLIIPRSLSLPEGAEQVIVVGLGDSFDALAARYGVPAEALGRLNRVVNPARLYAGLTLSIPPAEDRETGLVRLGEGESLWQVALRSDVNPFTLALANRIADPLLVAPGRLLRLPGGETGGEALPAPWRSIVLHPLPLEQGRTGGLRVTTDVPGTLSGTFLARELTFITADGGLNHQAIFGLDRWTAPGLYPLTLTFQDQAGTVWTYNRLVLVRDGGYGSETIRLPEEIAAVLEDADLIAGENFYIQSSMTGFTPERYWDGLFLMPSTGVLTSAYGTARTYNNGRGLYSFHTGADFAAPVGTPVIAPADGVVVDTGLLDIRGFTTIIDHGWGVYSGYWHQSSILVEPGDTVTAGQQIGTIGNSGLSTASHLHWELWVGGVQVDPLQWVREEFP